MTRKQFSQGPADFYEAAAARSKPDVSSPLKAALVKAEASIRADAKETGIFMDASGQELLRRTAEPDRVSFSDVPDSLMRGNAFTHNHPHNGNFSLLDVRTAADLQLASLRAVGPSRRYILEPLGQINGWPSARELERGMQEIMPQARLRALERVVKQGLPMRSFDQESFHQLYQLLATRFNLRYIRETS